MQEYDPLDAFMQEINAEVSAKPAASKAKPDERLACDEEAEPAAEYMAVGGAGWLWQPQLLLSQHPQHWEASWHSLLRSFTISAASASLQQLQLELLASCTRKGMCRQTLMQWCCMAGGSAAGAPGRRH